MLKNSPFRINDDAFWYKVLIKKKVNGLHHDTYTALSYNVTQPDRYSKCNGQKLVSWAL